ncbi:ankyrin [Cubamyces menziesii]|nr:ankyrin [Cubamyces menziesii]
MSRAPGSGGLVVPAEMQKILDQPGFLPNSQGGSRLRDLYRISSAGFDPMLLSDFAKACFLGAFDVIKMVLERGEAPDLSGRETAHLHSYAALTLFGAQHTTSRPGSGFNHEATLRYLLEHGANPDTADILGFTPLHHACMAYTRPDFARVLLEHGANPNARDRFGSVPLMDALDNGAIDAIDVLMEFGARLDIKDADGNSPDSVFLTCGPKVTAVIQKWKRIRAGATNPTDQKACAVCSRTDVQLKWCARCHQTWYCSRECQRLDWPTHRQSCVPHTEDSTVTLKPIYDDNLAVTPMLAMLGRQAPKKNMFHGSKAPQIPPGTSKHMIVKVQVPFDLERRQPSAAEVGDLMVYDKKRTFVCRIRKMDNPAGYLRVSQAVRTRGVGGAKAYFSAELTSPDQLIIKVSEVLPEQAF